MVVENLQRGEAIGYRLGLERSAKLRSSASLGGRMKRMVMAVLALGLLACGARAQQAPAKAPAAAPPAKSPAAAPAQSTAGQTPAPSLAPGFKTQKEKVSYAIGVEMGKGVKVQGIDVDPTIVMQGLKDGLSGAKPQMSEEELRQVITALQQEIRQKQMQA